MTTQLKKNPKKDPSVRLVTELSMRGVRTHNLKNIDVVIPHGKITVITGVSGSGKSSLAFDTLYAEGQRRFIESLSAYARQFLSRMEKPDFSTSEGLRPAVAIEGRNFVQNARSTVGTQTEVNDYLRVLFARIAKAFCSLCGKAVEADSPTALAERLLQEKSEDTLVIAFEIMFGKVSVKVKKEYLGDVIKQGFTHWVFDGQPEPIDLEKASRLKAVAFLFLVDQVDVCEEESDRLREAFEIAYRYGKGLAFFWDTKGKKHAVSQEYGCAECGKHFKRAEPNIFSFNNPAGACPMCQGYGRVITVDRDLVIPNPRKSLKEGAVEPWTKPSFDWHFVQMLEYASRKKISVDTPYEELSTHHQQMIWEGAGPNDDYVSIKDFFTHLERKTYKMHVRVFLSKYRAYVSCNECLGTRLRKETMFYRIGGRNISELQAMTVDDLLKFLNELPMSKHEEKMVGPMWPELMRRVSLLQEVGLNYITLDRMSRTLSGGEAQRIQLTSALGASLTDTLYVLDEPSIGLHERENEMLIRLLRKLRDLGNTVVLVEHDRQMIESADHVIDMGPDAGESGGQITWQGSPAKIQQAKTWTGDYLSGRRSVGDGIEKKKIQFKGWIKVKKASQHNLKAINLKIPLGGLVVFTGVSGSGKSTLMHEILYKHYLRSIGTPVQDLGEVQSVSGWDAVSRVLLVDQSPIGRSPRSNPVTYIKGFDAIRKLFSSSSEAKHLGLGPGAFSFNVPGGRCEKCEGAGKIKVEMHFLADIFVECEKCQGLRYGEEVLKIRFQGKNIADILNLTFDEATDFFKAQPEITRRFLALRNLGLGYLRLGQSALTLSQGEAQRMKLAVESLDLKEDKALYLFDEPTTGLHYHDIRFLLTAFRRLIGRGQTVWVIEHNMELIRHADYIIDLGPEGGQNGGEVLFSGTLDEILSQKPPSSATAKYLSEYIKK